MAASPARKAETLSSATTPTAKLVETAQVLPAGYLGTSALMQSGARINAELAQFAARRLGAQMTYWQDVATCRDPMALSRVNAAFWQTAMDGYQEEWKRLLGLARTTATRKSKPTGTSGDRAKLKSIPDAGEKPVDRNVPV